jgi:5-methylcytosine-specific restriction endonuclease McrA
MERTHSLTSFSDDELLRRLSDLLGQSRRDEADLVAHIGEVDSRRLYAREASPSMFAYCTEVLHLSEAEAYLRIAAARASREHPLLLTMLADGRLHLTAIAKLAPHLTLENREVLLKRAAHRSRREVEELVAELSPRPDAPAVMRKLPDRRDGTMSPGPRLGPDAEALSLGLRPEGGASVDPELRPDGVATREPELRPDRVAAAGVEPRPPGAAVLPASSGTRPAVIEPLAPARYRVQFTASAELHDKLERLRALMRPSVPDGDLGAIVEQAVTEKLQRLEARRFARTQAPRETPSQSETSPTTRQIPAAVKRAVYERDGGRCCYADKQGRRCTARQGLEFHHRHPFGRGGDHSLANVALVCRSHNGFLAEVDYGREAIARHRRSRIRPLQPTPSPSQ